MTANEKGSSNGPVAYQGYPGSYSDIASREHFPGRETLPCHAFEDALDAVRQGDAALGLIPIDNSVAGRVADVHQLLPRSNLHIIGEHYLPIRHNLLALPGVTLDELKYVRSHVHALSQCRNIIRELGLTPVVAADTAGSAADLAKSGDRQSAAIASSLAGEIYGLNRLKSDIEDAAHNTTRFVVLSREPVVPAFGSGLIVTSFIFRVRNVPAALYKAMGGFATNGINMTKLESYMVGGAFNASEFYVDVEAHPDERRMRLAMEELAFFSETILMLGSYPAHSYRMTGSF